MSRHHLFRTARVARMVRIVALASLAASIPVEAAALDYFFSKIADSSDGFSDFGDATLNNSGRVAFTATSNSLGTGVFRADGLAVETLATAADGLSNFGPRPAITSFGTVAFTAVQDTRRRVLRSDAPGSFEVVYTPTTLVTWGEPEHVDVNDLGLFVFTDTPSDLTAVSHLLGATSVFALGRAVTRAVFHRPAVNDVPITESPLVSVVVEPDRPLPLAHVYRVNLYGRVTPIALPATDSGLYAFGRTTSINRYGTVAFLAYTDDGATQTLRTGGGGLRLCGGVPCSARRADTLGPFDDFEKLSLNNNGVLAFHGVRGAVHGIYLGDDPVEDAVIETGDALAGSVVTALGFVEGGLNDAGEVVFRAELENGVRGIYRASAQGTFPLPDAGGPYFANAGIDLELDGSGSSDPEGIASWEWDLDGDGFGDFVSGQSLAVVPAALWEQLLQPGENEVALQVRDASGFYGIDHATVTLPTRCSDGVDNDQDGATDGDDTGCRSALDESEEPDCSDGLDNDGDGAVDYPQDAGCGAPGSAVEDPECDDGVDNDLNGLFDHPADGGCTSRSDAFEGPSPVPSLSAAGLLILGLALLAAAILSRRAAGRASLVRESTRRPPGAPGPGGAG